jgi:hypothetical protein
MEELQMVSKAEEGNLSGPKVWHTYLVDFLKLFVYFRSHGLGQFSGGRSAAAGGFESVFRRTTWE